MLTLEQFTEDFASVLKDIDSRRAVHKQFRPGIGPFGEADAVEAAMMV